MLSLLLALAPVAPPLPSGDHAREVYDALLARYRSAPALEIDFVASMAGSPELIRAEYRLARPLFGHVKIYMSDPPKEAVGDGTGFYFLEPADMSFQKTPGGLADAPLLGQVAPLRGWLQNEVIEPVSVRLVEVSPPQPVFDVLEVDFGTHTETLWVDPGHNLIAASFAMPMGGGESMEAHISFQRLEPMMDADPQDYSTPIPAGYGDSADASSSLIAAGTAVPELTITDLDGSPVRLESLRDKTVLLNFWFYH